MHCATSSSVGWCWQFHPTQINESSSSNECENPTFWLHLTVSAREINHCKDWRAKGPFYEASTLSYSESMHICTRIRSTILCLHTRCASLHLFHLKCVPLKMCFHILSGTHASLHVFHLKCESAKSIITTAAASCTLVEWRRDNLFCFHVHKENRGRWDKRVQERSGIFLSPVVDMTHACTQQY